MLRISVLMILLATPAASPRTYVALRGNPDARGEEVKAGFLTILGGGEIPEPPIESKSTGRRKALVNRIKYRSSKVSAKRCEIFVVQVAIDRAG